MMPDDINSALDNAEEVQVAGLNSEPLAVMRQALEDAPEVRSEERTAGNYLEETGGLFKRRYAKKGDSYEEIEPQQLANFTATIKAQVIEDDGAEIRRAFELEARMDGRTFRFDLPADRFNAMNWPIEKLGPGAIVSAGQGSKDHARQAIQEFSRLAGFSSRTVYCHTGWREVGGEPVYLHAGGAIGRDGPVSEIEVNPGEKLALYCLPAPPDGEPLQSAIRMSLSLVDVVAAPISAMLLGVVYRAPVGGVDMSACLAGRTGTRKSTVAALAQQHFGPEMDRLKLPENWSSTDNSLEMTCFQAKDSLLTVDEFKPSGPPSDQQKLHAKAGRILQAAGNHSGRGRLRADLTVRPDRRPRGLILVTGEDIPQGESTRARMAIVEVRQGDVPLGSRLDALQGAAGESVLAGAMAGYVRWLAGRYTERVKGWRKDFEALRGHFHARHARTPEVMAHLALGWRYFLDFAIDAGAIAVEDAEARFSWALAELAKLAEAQGRLQAEADPVHRFLELLGEAIASGRAHVVGRDGKRTALSLLDALLSDTERGKAQEESDGHSRTWGWRQGDSGDWHPQGAQVGWIEDDDLFLLPLASRKAAQEMANAGGDTLPVGARTLGKRLAEAGLLASVTSKDEHRVQRRHCGSRPGFLHVKAHVLSHPSGSVTSVPPGHESPSTAIFPGTDDQHGSAPVTDLSVPPHGQQSSRHRSIGDGRQYPERIGASPNQADVQVIAMVAPMSPILATPEHHGVAPNAVKPAGKRGMPRPEPLPLFRPLIEDDGADTRWG